MKSEKSTDSIDLRAFAANTPLMLLYRSRLLIKIYIKFFVVLSDFRFIFDIIDFCDMLSTP